MTSHDVVSRMRRIAGTRKVGHAGTLDPMATGVLLIGVERATRLLGLLALTDKAYEATIRLGRATVTDDAEGEETSRADTSAITDAEIIAGVVPLTGVIEQRPSAVSAIKVGGVRSYARVRAGEDVELPPRTVTVSRFDILGSRRSLDADGRGFLDVDVSVTCGSGTYIRALARDLGAALGVGGHLTALRRTRVGPFGLGSAHPLEELEQNFSLLPLGDVLTASYPRLDVDAVTAMSVLHGHRVVTAEPYVGPVGIFGPQGEVLSLAELREGALVPLVVFS
ncbi:MAG: tRNA pseudouridine(55) synthase TruB [Actinobacteria bacterium]|nr:tRNA pseudouridine(55) synthase TruB [Actinomycetota bacterium]MSW36467.1 tRNA pseudouridine(55) synthase TruB [Actinomycetota bacterium]MSX38642.1 tRNA pseudouridine(55) synthase TruB [Actinomycetota bacterium]